MRMEHSNIAKTNQPFWICGKTAEINLIDHPDCSVAAAGSYNGLYAVIINKTLQVPGAQIIIAGKLVI